MTNLSLYLHIPFCTVKCSYCAFNVYTHLEHLIPPFIDALCHEITLTAQTNPGHTVHTIYFGGGTPSRLTADQYNRILTTIRQHFPLTPNVEISTEANPDDLTDPAYIRHLRALGIRRLSIGVQSTHEAHLSLFGRLHTQPMIPKAVANARAAGVDDLNLDLIYGIPGQTLAMWQQTLTDTLALSPDHLSLYALGIEPKTAMQYWVQHGKVTPPDDDLAADMYTAATNTLAAAGFIQYEISNWAKPGKESQHNKQYWYNRPYLGLGPGAHGYAGGVRTVNEKSPQRYIKALQTPPITPAPFPITPATIEQTPVSPTDERAETIMMSLRLLQEGISLIGFEQRFGVNLLDLRRDAIETYIANNMLTLTDNHLRLTDAGRFISNRILRDLI